MSEYPDWLIDKRTVKRYISKGLVDSKTLDKHIEQLPDVSSNAEVISIDDPEQGSETHE